MMINCVLFALNYHAFLRNCNSDLDCSSHSNCHVDSTLKSFEYDFVLNVIHDSSEELPLTLRDSNFESNCMLNLI